jgi:hypothetical protein
MNANKIQKSAVYLYLLERQSRQEHNRREGRPHRPQGQRNALVPLRERQDR